MNNNITPHLSQTSARIGLGRIPSKPLFMALLALWTVAGTGCYRATGLQRNPTAAEVLPETAGDKVLGLKAKGGAGDLFIGNDFIQVAIDSTVFGDPARTPVAGAASGGSIIDAGYVLLDSSFTRVSMPGNAMNRLTPVVNQDPRMQMVFDAYLPVIAGELASVTMTGGVLDAGGARMAGVAVNHRISVALLDRFFTLSTTVTNNSGASIPIRSIGDSLAQQGGGYAFNIPADTDAQDNALATPWGVQIPAFTDFAHPLATSVRAAMVGLMDTEPGADTVDSHCSLGILPVDADQLLVAADPQDLLTVSANLRPRFPERLVAGSLGEAGDLAPGASLTYNRRLYIVGGTSVAPNVAAGLDIAASFPNQATGLFNLMDTHRFQDTSLRPMQDVGLLTFTLAGVSQRQGPAPTEIRIERNVNGVPGLPPSPGDRFRIQRVEWFEPNENVVSQTDLAPSSLQVKLPVGIYRMVLRSRDHVQTRTLFQNINVVANPDGNTQLGTEGPIWIQKNQTFVVNPQDILCPDAAPDPAPNQVGPITNDQFSQHFFTTREANAPAGNLQPMRITFLRTDVAGADPVMRRMRTLASFYDPTSRRPQVAAGAIPGQYQFRGGNEMFGTGFTRIAPTQFAWFANGGSYTAHGTRGPMEGLQTVTLQAFAGQTDTSHALTAFSQGLPPQWTSFDLPGPSQATTGGYLPGEKLASATANGVQVLGHTERDLLVDAPTLYAQFFAEFASPLLVPATLPSSLSAAGRPAGIPFGFDPFVLGGRTSALAGFGEATALFTPVAGNASLGGALVNRNWTLADFLAQGQGEFNVVHRPRGPQGLFTLQGAPVLSDPANWWNQTGLSSVGRINGAFDGLELLRAEGLNSAGPAAWFAEFQAVRADWFAILGQQSPGRFTKALGLSSAQFSIDTPVGLARTYLKASPVIESDLTGVLAALKSGAAVASTGPFLDVRVGAAGPGQTVPGPVTNVTLVVNLWKTDWTPVDELRVIVNGVQVVDPAINLAALLPSGSDPRLFTGSFNLTLPARDSWIVVEAGVPLAGPVITPANQQLWATWNAIMRNIYPIAVTNPIFVDVLGDGYPIPAP